MTEEKGATPDLPEFSIEQLEEGVHHVNNPIIGLKPIEKMYLQSVTDYTQVENNFYFSDGSAKVEVRVVSDEIIRVRLAPQGTFLEEFSYAVPKLEYRATLFSFRETEETYRVETNTVSCVIDKKDFLISFEDNTGLTINSDFSTMHWEENVDFGGYYVYCTKMCEEKESFFGLGDKATNFNLRGRRFQNWATDTYSYARDQDPLYRAIPFYLGLKEGISYGIFLDNSYKTHFDFAHQESNKTSFWADGGELQYYYIHGPHMMDVVKRYSSLTGTHPLPPQWALGFHQCRWSYYPENKLF